MSCESASKNATAPEPGIAPARRDTPAGQHIDPLAAAADLAARFGPGGLDPRATRLIPGFDAPFYQAGLAGYSDAAMRLIARRHGCPMCVTEALLDRTLLGGGRGFTKADLGDLKDNVPGGDDDHPITGQIMGSVPEEMAAAAVKMIEQGSRREREYRELVEQGDGETKRQRDEVRGSDAQLPQHNTQSLPLSVSESLPPQTFAAIDVNLACPVKKIAKKARGGHWLAQPEGAIKILEAVRDAVPAHIPVTVKMRRSFDDSPEMTESFFKIFDAAYDIGCAWVTVHGRTVEQRYIGPSRWDLLRDIATRDHPGTHKDRLIFGSGDIWTAADVFRMIRYTGLTGCSVARGCIGNPWIFRQCRDYLAGREPVAPTLDEQRTVLLDHFALAHRVNARLVRGKTEDTRLERAEEITSKTMRKFALRFAQHHPNGEDVRRAFIRVDSADAWRAVLDEHYPSPQGERAGHGTGAPLLATRDAGP